MDIRFRNINFFQRLQGFPLTKKENPLGSNIKVQGKLTIITSTLKVGNEIDLAGDCLKFITTSSEREYIFHFISKKEEEIYKLFGEWIPEYESSVQREVRESFASLVNDNMYVLTQMIFRSL